MKIDLKHIFDSLEESIIIINQSKIEFANDVFLK